MTARFFDSRAAYLLFSTATNEKPVVAARIGAELDRIGPGSKAIRFDILRAVRRRAESAPRPAA